MYKKQNVKVKPAEMWKGGVIAAMKIFKQNWKMERDGKEREKYVPLADLQQLYLSQIDKEFNQTQSY